MKQRTVIYLLTSALCLLTSAYSEVYVSTNLIGSLSPSARPQTHTIGKAARYSVFARNTGGAIDLSDYTVQWQVRDTIDGEPIGNIATQIRDATNGHVIAYADWTGQPPGLYRARMVLFLNETNAAGLIADDWLTIVAPAMAGGGASFTITTLTTGIVGVAVTTNDAPAGVETNESGVAVINIPPSSGGGDGVIQTINSSTVAHHRVVAGRGMTVSNVVDGATNSIYVSFGDTTPLVSTNTGWSRYQFDQVAAGVGEATSQYLTVTNEYGADVYYKSWGGGGGSTGNGSGGGSPLRIGSFFAPSGSVIEVQVAQGGARYSTNGVVRAWPDGGLSTNTTTANSCGGASSRIWMDGTLLEVTPGGGGGTVSGYSGGVGGHVSIGGSGTLTGAGTGATQMTGGLIGGGYLQGGDGPGNGGGGGYYGGGAGQINASSGGGGSPFHLQSVVLLITAFSASGNIPGGTADPDWTSGIGNGGSNGAGGLGRIVLYIRPREATP